MQLRQQLEQTIHQIFQDHILSLVEEFDHKVCVPHCPEEERMGSAAGRLFSALSREERELLSPAQFSLENARLYLAQRSFSLGLLTAGGQQEIFDPIELVENSLLESEYHPAYIRAKEEFFSAVENAARRLRGENRSLLEEYRHASWQRLRGLAFSAFYLGYRMGLTLRGMVHSETLPGYMPQTLYIEYLFGLTTSMEEREERRAAGEQET